MDVAVVFLAFAAGAALLALLMRRLGGMRGAVWCGAVLTLAAAVLFFWLRHDAQGKQGWDAIGNGIGMAMAILVALGYWIGVGIAALRLWYKARRAAKAGGTR